MREALPDRYLVDRRGTPDPDQSRYYVLDPVHDSHARVALALLVRSYRLVGASMKADELEAFLEDTKDAHRAVVQARSSAMTTRKGRR